MNFSSWRFFACLTHLLASAALFRNKPNNIYASFSFRALLWPTADYDSEYEHYDRQFSAMIVTGILFQLFDLALLVLYHRVLNFWSVYHFVGDCIGALIVIWIIIDTYPWKAYHPVYWFCLFLPFVGDVLLCGNYFWQGRMQMKGSLTTTGTRSAFWDSMRIVKRSIFECWDWLLGKEPEHHHRD